MDLKIFNSMEKSDPRSHIEFLLWHYRVIDAFWYINITEHFDESTADRLNQKVWGRATAMAAKDLRKRFRIDANLNALHMKASDSCKIQVMIQAPGTMRFALKSKTLKNQRSICL